MGMGEGYVHSRDRTPDYVCAAVRGGRALLRQRLAQAGRIADVLIAMARTALNPRLPAMGSQRATLMRRG
jgi:hypothetical protein